MAKNGDAESATWFGNALRAIGDYTKAAVDFAVDHTFEIATGAITGVATLLAGGDALAQEPAPEIVINAFEGKDKDDDFVKSTMESIPNKLSSVKAGDRTLTYSQFNPQDIILRVKDKADGPNVGTVGPEDEAEAFYRDGKPIGVRFDLMEVANSALYKDIIGDSFATEAAARSEAANKLIAEAKEKAEREAIEKKEREEREKAERETRERAEKEAREKAEAEAKKKATEAKVDSIYRELESGGNIYRFSGSDEELKAFLEALGEKGKGLLSSGKKCFVGLKDRDRDNAAEPGESYVILTLDKEEFSQSGADFTFTGDIGTQEIEITDDTLEYASKFKRGGDSPRIPEIKRGYMLTHQDDIREIAGLFHIDPSVYEKVKIDIVDGKAGTVEFIKKSGGTPHTFEGQDVEHVQDALAEYLVPIQQEVPEASSEAGEILGLYGITAHPDGFVIVKYDVDRDRSFTGTEDGIRVFPSHFAFRNFDQFSPDGLKNYPLRKRSEVNRDRTADEKEAEFARAGTILSRDYAKKAAVADRHVLGTSIQSQDDRWYLGANGRISLADFFAIEIEAAKTLYRDLEDGQLFAVGGEVKVMNPWGKKEFNAFRLGTNFSFTDNDREETNIYGRVTGDVGTPSERQNIITDRFTGNDDREHLRAYAELEFRDLIPQGFFRLNELNFGLFYDGIHEALTTKVYNKTETYDRTAGNPTPDTPVNISQTHTRSDEERTSHMISFFPEIGIGFSDRSDPRRIQIFDLNAQGMITYIDNSFTHTNNTQSAWPETITRTEEHENAWVVGLNLYSPGNPLPKLHPTFSASHFNSNRRGFGTIYDASLSFDLGSIHEDLDGSFVQLFGGYNAVPGARDGRRGGFVIGVPAWGPKSYTTDQAIKELSMERGVRRHNSLARGLSNRMDSNLPFFRPDGVYLTFTMGDTSEIDRNAGFASFSNTMDNAGNFHLPPRGIVYCGELSINGPGGRPFYLFGMVEGGRLDVDGDGHREPHWGVALGAGYKLP